MTINPAEADARDVYHALVGIVTPRPIAWVSSLDESGRVNLAPFSFFNVFGSNPPVVVFSPTTRRDGSKKDTQLNVEATGEFVVNAAVEPVAAAVNATSAEIPRGESEAARAGLTLVPSLLVKPPRVAESPAHLECRLLQVVATGGKPLSANLVVGEVVLVHVDDAVLGPDGRVDPARLHTVGRMGGDAYCRTSDLFRMARPDG
jgi:flavin reductase (DIM6/NTAB) family NADH-FMN oxidoreductase RutF